MNLSRVRKALVAGLGAAVSAVITALVNGDQPATTAGWAGLVAGAIGLGLATGVGVYFARNVGAGIGPNGSEVGTGSRVIR
jgi:hypothetical protein